MFSGGNRVFGVVSMRFGVIFGRFGVVWGVSTDPFERATKNSDAIFVNQNILFLHISKII